MRRYLVLLCTVLGCASSGSVVRVDRTDDSAIRATQIERAKAYVERDSTTLARLLAAEYVRVTTRALVRDKAQVIQFYLHSAPAYSAVESREVVVRLYGLTAVVQGIIEYQYRANLVKERNRYLEVFVKRDGRWQVVATQSTLLND